MASINHSIAVADSSDTSFGNVRRVLIYRLGSLGDTVVALPCFHLIAQTFPNAERVLLTNIPVNSKAPAAAAVLGSSGLVHRYLEYPAATRNPLRLARLAHTLRQYRADVLVYLAAPRGSRAVSRDARFFQSCGIRTIYGLPTGELGIYRTDPTTGLSESEAARLARSLSKFGDVQLDDKSSWDFKLSEDELLSARRAIESLGGRPYIVCAPGCKAPANDWEDKNWLELLHALSTHMAVREVRGAAIVFTGALSDKSRIDHLSAAWQGPSLNLCGNSPREAAALCKGALFYLGPDSGPMHIAAAAGTLCVAIFSGRMPYGVWFPRGTRHQVIYHPTSCSPCGLETCTIEKKRCLVSITPQQVLEACLRVLQATLDHTSPSHASASNTFGNIKPQMWQ